MSKFWKREEPLERELRTSFEPSAGLEEAISERVRQSAPRVRYARASHRLYLTALAVFMLGTFASFGGVGIAAQGATAPTVLAVTKTQSTLPFTGLSLLATVLLSMVFLGAGLILRRIGSRAPRSF